MTLPQKNGSRIKTPSSKSLILVSFCWKKKVLLINALIYLIESLIPLKLVNVGVAFFLGHPVYQYHSILHLYWACGKAIRVDFVSGDPCILPAVLPAWPIPANI